MTSLYQLDVVERYLGRPAPYPAVFQLVFGFEVEDVVVNVFQPYESFVTRFVLFRV